jgi:hypothetical protein
MPARPNQTPKVTSGAPEKIFSTVFLPGLVSTPVSFLNDRFAEVAQRAKFAILMESLGRDVANVPNLDREAKTEN